VQLVHRGRHNHDDRQTRPEFPHAALQHRNAVSGPLGLTAKAEKRHAPFLSGRLGIHDSLRFHLFLSELPSGIHSYTVIPGSRQPIHWERALLAHHFLPVVSHKAVTTKLQLRI
jgi:hypothetical protein